MGKKGKRALGESEDNQTPKAGDKDAEVFVAMSQELKEEGNKLFQRRDHEGAMVKYEKALRLLPRNHVNVPYLRSNVAACYMQMGLSEYPRAIHECNLALEVAPKYSKALLKRARCYEALNRLDLALRDVTSVLDVEPNNIMALEVSERVRMALEKKGLQVNDAVIQLPPDYVEPPKKVAKEKPKKKKSGKSLDKKGLDNVEEKKVDEAGDEKKTEDKAVVEEKISVIVKEVPKRTVKLVLGEDIRWAQLPVNCTLAELREVVCDRFPNSGAVLIKYRDQEGDLVTITSDEELRWAEKSPAESQGSIRFYIVDTEKISFSEKAKSEADSHKLSVGENSVAENDFSVKGEETKGLSCIEDWIINFAQMFKNHVGFESDSYLNIHDIGMKLYSEAMEETVTSNEAQDLFDTAGDKFQELAALALFNWGNVHMTRARKKVNFTEDSSKESILSQIESTYEWARREYVNAGNRYEEALKMKPDFHEGCLALGQQQFELAKLSWYYAISRNHKPETLPSTEVLQLYNKAEDNMEMGTQMWEEWVENRLNELSKQTSVKSHVHQMGLDGFFKDLSANEASEQTEIMRSHINLLWGTMLYERSIVEFKLRLPVWHESLEVAIEKFELAGASSTDIAVMVKNHCSNDNTSEGLGFKIDEIVQAWNDMYEAKTWRSGVPTFRLEPLLRRRVSKIYHALEQA